MSIKCPQCLGEIDTSPTKTWNFGKLTVKSYHCSACNKNFRSYQSIEGKELYTIPKRKV